MWKGSYSLRQQTRLKYSLTALGFLRKQTNELIVYREMEHNAIILLPIRDDRSSVGDPHLVGVTNTITGKGIATTMELSSLLYAPQSTGRGAPKSDAVKE